MTDFGTITLRRYGRDRVDEVRNVLIDVYTEVYAADLGDAFFSRQSFVTRLESHVGGDRWEAVIGYDGEQPVGYAYGASLRAHSRWWDGVHPPLTDTQFTAEPGGRTLALFELMVRTPWRGTGAAQAIHEELLRGRPEQRVSLGVELSHDRVRALYERWGYRSVGVERPFPNAPEYHLMVRDLS